VRLTFYAFLTLDGVMQAPGEPDEDRDGGFAYGGWMSRYGYDDLSAAIAGWLGQASAILLGRRTYQIWSGYWPHVTDPDDPIASKLNTLPKYVATNTLGSVDWHNSEILAGDVVAEVAKLKEQPGNELQLHASSELAQALIEHGLVDEYRLLFVPVHLGSGKKLFRGGPAPHRQHHDGFGGDHRHVPAGRTGAVRHLGVTRADPVDLRPPTATLRVAHDSTDGARIPPAVTVVPLYEAVSSPSS
jgi:dihydrofolate reductase